MADTEIEPAAEQAKPTKSGDKAAKKSKKKEKREKPDDAVKLGCGGLFRRKKKSKKEDADGAGEDSPVSKAPIEKPKPGKDTTKGTVKMEEGPQTSMWSGIVSNSMVGTGVFKRAAACSLETGGVLACTPAGFAPSVEQVAALRDNFASRGIFSGAGFGVADTVYRLQEETGTPEILSGADDAQTEGILVVRSNTALIIGTFTDKLNQAMEMLGDLRSHFIGQGL